MRPAEYSVWAAMKRRCYNPNYMHYSYYGGRGIKVCSRWRNSFEAFLKDMKTRPTPKHTLDRINTDGNYEPGNCQWVLQDAQTRNRRFCRILSFRGRRQTLAEWARELKLSPASLRDRLRLHPVEFCLSTPKGEMPGRWATA